MRYLEFRERIRKNLFTFLDVIKHFPQERPQTVKVQLSRFVKKGLLRKIKREFYCFDEKKIDEFELANRLYQPSYISLETALNFYGIIPDVPQAMTSVTLTTTKGISTQFGKFSYTKIKPDLFLGFVKLKSANTNVFFNIAKPEKAVLDFFYLRKIREVADLRLDLKKLDKNLYERYAKVYPKWVQKICP